VVESITADVPGNRLLIDGRFTGDTIPSSWFPNQAEGIVLYECGASSGDWITTDQGKVTNTFHVFDRVTLAHVGSFQLDGVLNMDGIALTQKGVGPFPSGAFYAVNDDGDVAAVGWSEIAKALGLRSDCPS
jgi:3-phytase